MPCGHDEAYLVMVCSGCWVLQKECPSSMLKLPHLRVGLTVFCRVRIVGHFDLSEVCIWPKWRYSKWSGPAASAIHPTHKATSHTHTHTVTTVVMLCCGRTKFCSSFSHPPVSTRPGQLRVSTSRRLRADCFETWSTCSERALGAKLLKACQSFRHAWSDITPSHQGLCLVQRVA